MTGAVTIVGTRLLGGDEPIDIRMADGAIEAIGPAATAPGDEIVDGAGTVAVAGLVNAHTHAAMTLLRGYGDDLPLMRWLSERIWPAEARLTDDAVYWGTRLACLEMASSGTTALWDMYFRPAQAARAAVDAGMRIVAAPPVFDGGPDASDADQRRARDAALADLEAIDASSPLVTRGLAPHSVYTVSEPTLAWVAETAADHDLTVQIHLAETAGEVEDCRAAYGVGPAELLDRVGLLGPRTVVAHGCWLTPDDLHLLAERQVTVASCPVSNMKLAVGRTFPYREASVAGVGAALGTDGAASNNSLDLLADLKTFALAQKMASDDPAVAPAAEVLAVAAGQRSPAIAGTGLVEGGAADLFLVSTERPATGLGDPTAAVVYGATGADVVDTFVAGRAVTPDPAETTEVMARARAEAAALTL